MMIRALFRVWKEHLTDHITLYLVTFMMFLLGSTTGAFVIRMLDEYQLKELVEYLDFFLKGLPVWQINSIVIAQDAVINSIKIISVIWLLGLTIVGIPIILVVVYVKGFILGFTVGFLLIKKSYVGLLISIFAVLPQNLFYIPSIIICAVAAVTFSLRLIRGTIGRSYIPLSQQFINYLLLLVLLFFISIVGGIIEGYFAPYLMKIIVTYF
ncbi:MAG: stage II sporulation protein M [Bacillota bacterium]